MSGVSELARQLYQAILEKGYTSPENTWENFGILDELHIINGNSYDWLRELRNAGLVIHIPATSIGHGERYYAVPPHGYVQPFEGSDDASNQLAASIAVNEDIPPSEQSGGEGESEGAQHIDWTKWGTIIGALGILVTVLIAVLS